MEIDNTSGHGAAAQVPDEIRGWNWGAFLLNWVWGIGNSALASLLVFVPLFGFVWMFVTGAKGNEWAWRGRRWESVAQFRAVQRRWAFWGAAVWLGSLAFAGFVFVGVFAMLKESEAYGLAQAALAADGRVARIVGRPFSTGLPMGSIAVSGPSGSASLSFSVKGPKGQGTAFVEASKVLGQWKVKQLVFETDETGERIDVLPAPKDALPAAAT